MPDFWMDDTSGVLRPVIEAYLNNEPMIEAQIATMRAYLRQWITDPVWQDADELRAGIDGLTSRIAISEWLGNALDLGIDPL